MGGVGGGRFKGKGPLELSLEERVSNHLLEGEEEKNTRGGGGGGMGGGFCGGCGGGGGGGGCGGHGANSVVVN